jgi:hypothetical protein
MSGLYRTDATDEIRGEGCKFLSNASQIREWQALDACPVSSGIARESVRDRIDARILRSLQADDETSGD